MCREREREREREICKPGPTAGAGPTAAPSPPPCARPPFRSIRELSAWISGGLTQAES